jgi:23S rRNA (cytidine1920-2'-O)/16S rRNA (cytidine1409-2'-O)-methyltransferase
VVERTGETVRLDRALVERSLARSRGHARDLVLSGAVRLGEQVIRRPSHAVRPEDRLDVAAGPVWVGRAAEKLVAALERWQHDGLKVRDAACVDVGASTGGFTQALLCAGARSVVAVDVGSGQLVKPIRDDPRVTELSGRHVLTVTDGEVDAPVDLVVVDVSFISLTALLGHLAGWLAPGSEMIVLVKPQFEVGRGGTSRRGIVTSAARRAGAVRRVIDAAYEAGLGVHDAMSSPLVGARGNREYLLRLAPHQPGMMDRARALRLAETLT